MGKELRGALLLLLTALIWGTAFSAQSIGMEYIGPFTFNFARTIVAAVVLSPKFWGLRAYGRNKRKISIKNTVVGGIKHPIIYINQK